MNDSTAREQINDTPEQKAFYDTFGFLVLRQAFALEEFQEIERAYEEVIMREAEAAGIGDRTQIGKNFVIDPGFCERHQVLMDLVEDDRIAGTAEHLLGPEAFYAGSDGSFRAGDTEWHPDAGWAPQAPEGRTDPTKQYYGYHYYPGLKVGIYLEAIGSETGCLRVIPGSSISPYHESLRSLHCDIPDSAPQLLEDPDIPPFGLAGCEIPALAIESNPGDVVFFSHKTWHAAYGGRPGRRLLAMAFESSPTESWHHAYAELWKRRNRELAEKFADWR